MLAYTSVGFKQSPRHLCHCFDESTTRPRLTVGQHKWFRVGPARLPGSWSAHNGIHSNRRVRMIVRPQYEYKVVPCIDFLFISLLSGMIIIADGYLTPVASKPWWDGSANEMPPNVQLNFAVRADTFEDCLRSSGLIIALSCWRHMVPRSSAEAWPIYQIRTVKPGNMGTDTDLF